MIAIIDSGIANLRSVEKALLRLGAEAAVIDDPRRLRDAAASQIVVHEERLRALAEQDAGG